MDLYHYKEDDEEKEKDFNTLPYEILVDIVSQLSSRDVLNLCRVNHSFYERLCEDPNSFIWKELYRKDISSFVNHPNNLLESSSINKIGEMIRSPIKIRGRSWKNLYLTIMKEEASLNPHLRLYYASEHGFDKILLKTLQSFKKEIDLWDLNWALMKASTNGHLEAVKLLIRAGADIHIQNEDSLRWASTKGHLEVVELLVQLGADIHSLKDYSLREASRNDHLEIVRFLLKAGANVHAEEDDAVRKASSRGHLEIVKLLIKHGANIHVLNDDALREAEGWSKVKREEIAIHEYYEYHNKEYPFPNPTYPGGSLEETIELIDLLKSLGAVSHIKPFNILKYYI